MILVYQTSEENCKAELGVRIFETFGLILISYFEVWNLAVYSCLFCFGS